VGSVNWLTRAYGALDGLVFYGEASDHGVARGATSENAVRAKFAVLTFYELQCVRQHSCLALERATSG